MLTREDIIEKLREVLPFLKKEFGIKKIGIFGSFTTGIQNKSSDIDIFIEFEKPIGLAFMDLADYLEDLFREQLKKLEKKKERGIFVYLFLQIILE